jgi:RNA polymerase sigma-70 factor, ECF subfamily
MNTLPLAGSNGLHKDESDRDTLFRIEVHDRRALERLYLSYYSPLVRLLSRVVTNASVVDEIIEETFMTIWSRAKEFGLESRVAVWIFEIAYRAALQSIRSQTTRGDWASIRGPDDDCESDKPSVGNLEHRLNRLPLEERVTLALAYQMGFSVEEIAKITGAAPVTVKIRISHARTSLRPVGQLTDVLPP